MAAEKLEGVAVMKKANVYFGGKVTSRTVLLPDGSRKTLGVMLKGEYEFGTEAAERMEVLAGEMRVRLPGATEFRTFRAGDVFDVPADSKFALEIEELADYCCSYL